MSYNNKEFMLLEDEFIDLYNSLSSIEKKRGVDQSMLTAKQKLSNIELILNKFKVDKKELEKTYSYQLTQKYRRKKK